jgi:ABC-type multidrug transport system ATPase subunit
LTTHHLEEAEELSQSIGIMVNGKMVIIGRAEYIKQKFNVGYHIILNFN